MNDRTSPARLKNLARTALGKHKTANRALPSFADAVWKEKNLVRFLLMPYLQAEEEIRAGKAQTRDAENGQGTISAGTKPFTRRPHVVHPAGPPSEGRLRAEREAGKRFGMILLDACARRTE